ncbi:MAG: SPASM domain-containing protein [SAR324 cluster bacterium]|nr:SPASM domain-containing protein [SAR324 cluster bacterium]
MLTRPAESLEVVEIEVNDFCNRSCMYCPNSLLTGNRSEKSKHIMKPELFRSIISQLASLDFSGRLSFHLYNEPLLCPNIEEYVHHAHKELRKSFIVLYTNGDLLDDEKYCSLMKSGVDQIFVTQHDYDAVKKRPNQIVQSPNDFEVSSRGGACKTNHTKLPLSYPCYAPTNMMIITVTGDLLLCHEDAFRDYVIGNLQQSPIDEVWNSKKIKAIRAALVQGRRDVATTLCRRCDCRLYFRPGVAI